MLFISLLCCPAVESAFANSEEELATLRMFYKEDEIVVTPTRFPKLASQTAENITVITAKEIEEMNAHTLADVLLNVTGVQIDNYTGLGGLPSVNIQGSYANYVIVLIDGVIMNYFSSGQFDMSALPLQNIERIEIIKGPASSAWGSSLGGVINVITKAPSLRKLSGALSASLGERNTGDYRTEASGRSDNFSYYLYGGHLKTNSNGTVQNFGLNKNSFYTKLSYDITQDLNLMFTTGYIKDRKSTGEWIRWDERDTWNYEYLFSTLQADYTINGDSHLKATLRTNNMNGVQTYNTLSTGQELYPPITEHNTNTGGSVLFNAKIDIHSITIGSDIDYGSAKQNTWAVEKRDVNRQALFASDTVSFGKLTIIPGIRYDHVIEVGSIVSPSLGATYKLTNRTLLKFFAAKGFNAPNLGYITASSSYYNGNYHTNSSLKYEKVTSVQAGIETTAIKYLFLTANLFSHSIKDAMDYVFFDDGTWTVINKNRQKREGIEAGLKTLPVYNTSLTAGVCYVNARDMDTGERIMDIARYTYDIGLRYDDTKTVFALLKGHYIKWETRADNNPKHLLYGTLISQRRFTLKINSRLTYLLQLTISLTPCNTELTFI